MPAWTAALLTLFRLPLADCDDVAFGPQGDLYFACHSPSELDPMDAVVARLNPRTGKTVFLTKLPGDSFEAAFRIRVDSQGRAYTTGLRRKSQPEAFVAVLSPQGEVTTMTPLPMQIGNALDIDERTATIYVGGNSGDNSKICVLPEATCRTIPGLGKVTGVLFDRKTNSLYVSATTVLFTRLTLPSLEPAEKLDTGMQGWAIAGNGKGTIAIAGIAERRGRGKDAFVTLIRNNKPVRTTYVGGSNNDECGYDGTSVAFAPNGETWLTGITYSSDLPAQGVYKGNDANGFISVFDRNLKRVRQASYFNNGSNRYLLEGIAISADGKFIAATGVSFQPSPQHHALYLKR